MSLASFSIFLIFGFEKQQLVENLKIAGESITYKRCWKWIFNVIWFIAGRFLAWNCNRNIPVSWQEHKIRWLFVLNLYSSLKRTPLWPKFNSSTWELVCSQFANGMLSLLILFCSALYTTSSHWGRKLIFRGALDNQVDSTGFLSQGKFH